MPQSPDLTSLGQRNRLFGWTLFLIGIFYGMAIGLFAFNGPLHVSPEFADYASLPRRFVRFAHIACMALGMVNVQYGHEIDRLALAPRRIRTGAHCMIAAGILMPTILTLAAFQQAFKWLLPVPSVAALIAINVVVAGLWRRRRNLQERVTV
jgi:amino acid transporter